MNWKAIFFDLDGTLIHTSPEIADAVNDTLRDIGLPEVTQDQVDRWIGQGTRELLILAMAHVQQQSTDEVRGSAVFSYALPIFDRQYQARCGTRSELYPHVRDTLKTLREKNCRLAVVTNKEDRYTQTILKQHNLLQCFDLVVSGDTFADKKPNPVGVMYGLGRWQIKPADALFVGDSSIDAATARNAGLSVWLLPYGYNMGRPVETCSPDRVIQDFSELI
jgi:phosphoglycolate phosphatase